MKNVLKLVAVFFILIFSLVFIQFAESSTISAQLPFKSSDYIREIKSESVVLISVSTHRGELTSRQSESNLGLTNIFPCLLAFIPNNIFFEKQIIGFYTSCICNLFNNLRKIYQIRAP